MDEFELRPEQLLKNRAPYSRDMRRGLPVAANIMDLRKSLRTHRKSFLGTYISLRKYIRDGEAAGTLTSESLQSYLTKRTKHFWNFKKDDAEEFIGEFYTLAFCCLLEGDLSYECIDDIIQLAECLVRSRVVFTIAAKEMLPKEMFGELFDFTEQYDDSYFTAEFEDAVLGAVSVLSGALADPIAEETQRGAK